jgi:hypothetical protein
MSKKAKGALAVLGHGVDSYGRPSIYTEQRAQTAAEYYKKFSSQIGLIICSGRYPRNMVNPPDNGGTEAGSIGDILVLAGVPGSIIKYGEEATCTFTNFMEMKSNNLIDDTEIDPDYPLRIVTGGPQAPRARFIGRRTLALPRHAVRSVISPGEDNKHEIALEYFATAVAHLVLLGVEPGNLEAIDKARLRYEAIADRIPSHHNEFSDGGDGTAAVNLGVAHELVIVPNSQGLIEF